MANTDSETHIDERTVPMNSGPRILSIVKTAGKPGMTEKHLKRENQEY